MRRIRAGGAILAAVAFATTTAGPVTALDPEAPAAYLKVVVQVTGYVTPDIGGFGGVIVCTGDPGVPDTVDFGITPGSLETGLMTVPPGATCSLSDISGGDPGNLGSWGDWWVSPAEAVTTVAGETTTFTVTIERSYMGQDPEWDAGAWFPFEAFTVDRVYLNRYGGITAEGLVLCRAFGQSGSGIVPIIGINWDATQYLGRRTAIHGSYGSDIGKFCFDPAHPTTPVRWQSMHPGTSGAEIAWVYGVNGKFGSGTIRIDADGYNEMPSVTQWWDPTRDDFSPACSATYQESGWYDSNGDGFCAFYVQVGQRVSANVRTVTVRTR